MKRKLLLNELFELTGCKTVNGALVKMKHIEKSYDDGKVPTTKEGCMGGRVMSDQYQEWAHQRTQAETLIKKIERLKINDLPTNQTRQSLHRS